MSLGDLCPDGKPCVYANCMKRCEATDRNVRSVHAAKPLPEDVLDEIERLVDEWGVLTAGTAKQIARFAMLAQARIDAEIASATICDMHLPTGVRIYGNKAADAIKRAAGIETDPSAPPAQT